MPDSTRQDLNFFNLPGDNYDLNSPETPDLTVLDSTAFSSALKISHKTNIYGSNLQIAQCNENSCDIDLSHNITIINSKFGTPDSNGKIGRADQVITIKGGCSHILIDGMICSKPTRSKAHVQIGNWMDQDYSLNHNIHLNLISSDGSPVYYSTGWVKPFSVYSHGREKWLLWESIGLKIYWVAKWFVRLCLRIPKGVKGPSWM